MFKVEDLFLLFAKKASAFNSWFENAEEDLTDPVRCNSVEEIRVSFIAHVNRPHFTTSFSVCFRCRETRFDHYHNNVSLHIAAELPEPIRIFHLHVLAGRML